MTGRRDVFDQAMSKGHSAAWDMQWDHAIACYRAALTEFPDDPKALTSLGYAMLQADRPEEALPIYQRATALTPGDPVAPEKVGEILERLGKLPEAGQTYLAVAEIHLTRRDVDKAIENWTRVVRITPDNLAAHSRLALALERTNKMRPASLEYLEVARIFQRNGEIDKAMQAANRALQLEPQSLDAHGAIDKLKRGVPLPVPAVNRPGTGPLGAKAPAVPLIDPFAEEEPVKPHSSSSPLSSAQDLALAQLAEMLFEEDTDTGKVTSSVNSLTRGSGVRDPVQRRAQAIMYLGQALHNQTNGNAEVALNNFENAIQTGFDHPAMFYMAGLLSFELKRPNDAIKYLKNITANQDFGLGAVYGLGTAYFNMGQTSEALGNLLEALQRLDLTLVGDDKHEALLEAYEGVADSLVRTSEEDQGKITKGLMQFFSGDDWEDRARTARKNLDSGAAEGQVSPLAELLATPGSDEVLASMRRIEEYIGKKFWATAMEEAFYAIEHSPTHLPVHMRMAEILMAENKTDAAIAKLSAVAESYRMRGEAGRATRVIQDVLRMRPFDVGLRGKLIETLNDQGKVEEAVAQYIDLADTYYQLADTDSARTTYTDALKLAQQPGVNKSWSVRILHQMADIDMQRLAWRDALKAGEQIRAIAPDDVKARGMLVDLNFRMGNDRSAIAEIDSYIKFALGANQIAQAVALLEEISVNHSESAAIVARLAKLYNDQGRKAEAIVQYDRLGEIQLNAGENAQAVETIKTIIALGPDDPSAYQELLAQIQQG